MVAQQKPFFLMLNGIPRADPPEAGEVAYFRDPQGAWRPLGGDLLDEIEAECIGIHDGLAAALFGTLQRYHDILPFVPSFIPEAGLNSESTVSRQDFERMLVHLQLMPHLNRLLYLYDCRKLVSAIQECTKEVCYLCGEFYRILNLDELFFPPVREPDGLRFLTSPVVTLLTATLNVIYIRLHSLLDFTTKLVFEMQHLRSDFDGYPKLSSSNILYGDRRRLKWSDIAGTLFETANSITEIELVRNLVIHDGLLDDMPKAYKLVENGCPIEKYVLMPDRIGGRLERYRNRAFFYSSEDKINLRLPDLVGDFQERQVKTLRRALLRLASAATKPSARTP